MHHLVWVEEYILTKEGVVEPTEALQDNLHADLRLLIQGQFIGWWMHQCILIGGFDNKLAPFDILMSTTLTVVKV